MMQKIAIIGCGNLGTAIALGLKNNKSIQRQIIATRNNVSLLKPLEAQGITITSDNKSAVSQSNIILLAVKPFMVVEVLKEILPYLAQDSILVSLATGITIGQIKEVTGEEVPVIRAMPNTATAVNESLTCITAIDTKSKQYLDLVGSLFDDIGEKIIIKEELMDAATVLGACGIAYVMRFIRSMVQGGIEIGFDAKTASYIAHQTVRGAAQLLIDGNSHPEQEIDKVTTPRGCTIVGLNEMEHQGFSSALIKGIVASFKKIETNM